MGDPETKPPLEPTTRTQSSGAVTLNVSYVKSPRGILKIVEIFLLLIAFACFADDCNSSCQSANGRFSFFLFSTIFPWLLCIIIFVLFLFCIVEKIPQIKWNMTVLINSIIWAIVILISSSLVADWIREKNAELEKINSATGLKLKISDNIYVAVVFGFLSVIAFVIDAFFHFKLVRS